MKITFLSNVLNHHQISFSQAMYVLPEVEYHFVATSKITQERISLGYRECTQTEYPFLINYNDEKKDFLDKLIDESDFVIIGSAPYKLIENRIKNNKLTFAYSEHLFKCFRDFLCIMLKGYFIKNYYLPGKQSNFYMLCASGYLTGDLNKIGAYKNKTYKWGYFPETKTQNIDELLNNKNKKQLLWVGRFIKWKHPENAITVAKYLMDRNYEFNLVMIGTGKEKENIEKMIKKYKLENYVTLTGAMPTEEVREYMDKSNIFMFTSDFNEGWGAVLNEAMNSGCAVVVSHSIGAVPFLIKNGDNGLIYKNGDIRNLCKKVESLLQSDELAMELGEKAYNTVYNEWNAQVATNRLLALSKDLLKYGKSDRFVDGPCSKARQGKSEIIGLQKLN